MRPSNWNPTIQRCVAIAISAGLLSMHLSLCFWPMLVLENRFARMALSGTLYATILVLLLRRNETVPSTPFVSLVKWLFSTCAVVELALYVNTPAQPDLRAMRLRYLIGASTGAAAISGRILPMLIAKS